MKDQMLLKTPLYDWHTQAKAKIVEFGGWLMPVSYTSVIKEHNAVRTSCGIFDVSHMGEFIVEGPDAKDFLNFVTINDVGRLTVGQGQYTALLQEDGGIIDDLIIYLIDDHSFLICVNASNTAKDYAWLEAQLKANPFGYKPTLTDVSAKWSLFAVQGPNSFSAIQQSLAEQDKAAIEQLDYMRITRVDLCGATCLVARTGYTGEFGYEIYVPADNASAVWSHMIECGAAHGIMPCGLGARDTLRLEAGYPLYGSDMDAETNPFEVGIKWAVRMEKSDFIGKNSLIKATQEGIKRAAYAFEMVESGIPRNGMLVLIEGQVSGHVTSGSVLPTVGGAGGLALIDAVGLKPGTEIEIDVRGKRKLARIAKRPLYSPRVR